MPVMAGTTMLTTTLGLGLLGGQYTQWDWLPLQYLVPLISFVCVGLEGWCFFDLLRKTIDARSARHACARDVEDDDDEIDLYEDGLKDFPQGGFVPSNNQLCIHGLLGIRMQAKQKASGPSAYLTAPCGCQVVTTPHNTRRKQRRRRELSYITI